MSVTRSPRRGPRDRRSPPAGPHTAGPHTSLSTLENWAEPLREHRLRASSGRRGDGGRRGGPPRSLWYCSLALAEATEAGWGAPGVKETPEGEDTEEDDGGGAWAAEGGGAGSAGRGAGGSGSSGGGEEVRRPRPDRDTRRGARSDRLPDRDGFCGRSGREEEEERRWALGAPPKLWQCWNSSSWLREETQGAAGGCGGGGE